MPKIAQPIKGIFQYFFEGTLRYLFFAPLLFVQSLSLLRKHFLVFIFRITTHLVMDDYTILGSCFRGISILCDDLHLSSLQFLHYTWAMKTPQQFFEMTVRQFV
jgi:hypothetical protein